MGECPHRSLVIIGAGNVATHLAPALEASGAGDVVQVYSRTIESARALASRLKNASAVSEVSEIIPDADVYIVSLVDRVVPELIASLPHNGALWIHTSGSLDKSVLSPLSDRVGVLYPLQTFSRDVDVDMSKVPFFIEGSDPDVEECLQAMTSAISPIVHHADSALRARMHVAAVFACNFVNHMFVIADDLLRPDGLDLSVLYPLIEETMRKAMEGNPASGQTGPAVRGDTSIVERHASTLPPDLADIYRRLSASIHQRHIL